MNCDIQTLAKGGCITINVHIFIYLQNFHHYSIHNDAESTCTTEQGSNLSAQTLLTILKIQAVLAEKI